MDKKTKVTSSRKERQKTTVTDKIAIPVEQMKMLDIKNSVKDGSPLKKKNHHKLLKNFFDSIDGTSDDSDSDYGSGGISGDGSTAEGSGGNADEPSAVKKQYAQESLNDLEDDLENEVNTLLSKLGSNFTRDSSQLLKVATHSNEESSYSKEEVKKSTTDPYKTGTPYADEDILDMIANILEDHPSQMTKHIDMFKEQNADKKGNKKDNIANVSSEDTYFIPLTSKVSKDLNKKSSPTFSNEKFSQTNVVENHIRPTHVNSNADKRDQSTLSSDKQPQDLTPNQNLVEHLKANYSLVGPQNEPEIANDAISALKQSGHQRSNKDLDSVWYGPQQLIPDTDLGLLRETSGAKQKSLVRKEYDEKSETGTKRSGGKVNGNDTGSFLKFQTIPTPNSQLVQIFPGAVSYNVKLTDEESPPGKNLKEKPLSRTNLTSNSSRQSESSNSAILNHPSALSTMSLTKNDNDLRSNEAQAMTRRIFEVGQAAIEAGKNMILAQQTHVDKEKIYDIVGTRNVTSVGKYLITIGEELLNRGKTFSSKKIPSSKVPLKHRNISNFGNSSKNVTGAVNNVDYGPTEEGSFNKIVNASIPSHKAANLSCGVGEIHRNSSLRGRLRAGLFIPTGDVKDPNQCARQCCENTKCNMAMVVNDECYAVECFHWTLCQIVPYQGSAHFRSEIISIRRFQHRHNPQGVNDSLSSSSQTNDNTIKRKTSSSQRIKLQNHYPHRPITEEEPQKTWDSTSLNQSSAHMPDSKVAEKLTYNHSKVQGDPKATYVQREELNCRSSETGGSENLKPGNWRLSGKTGNSSKCVELCCSQSGCDLAFQIGEFCYSLACYEDNRGCNPLALPVGLSYLRFKRRKKLASKHTDILEEKLPRKVVLHGTTQSGKKDILERPIERQDDGISSPSTKVFNNSQTSSSTEMIQPTNWVGAVGSELCGYSIRTKMFFREGHNAGEFRQARNISDIDTCAKNCCNSISCDVAYMVENICFFVKCRDESSCEPVSVQNFEYLSSLIYVTNRSLDKSGLNSQNESAVSKGNETSTYKGRLKTNVASTLKGRGEQSDFSNKIVPAVNKKNNALQKGGHARTVSQGNDFDIVVDSDNDGDIINDADDGVHDYGTGDDDYGSRQVIESKHHSNEEKLKNFNKHNGVSELTIRGESNINKDRNYNGTNNTENYSSKHQRSKNQVSILTQPSFVTLHQNSSSENHTKLTSRTRNENLTIDHQVYGISTTGDLEKNNVKHGTKGIPYLEKQISGNQTLLKTLQVDHSGSGMHGHEFQGASTHSDVHNGDSSNDAPGDDRDEKSHDDVRVKVNDIGRPDVGLTDLKNPSSLDSKTTKPDSAKYNPGSKGIPSAISKGKQANNVLRRLEKKDDKSLDLSLQPPVLKDKNFNGETYVIYDDADNGVGFRSNGTLKHMGSSDAGRSGGIKLYSRKNPFMLLNISEIQNNRSEKPPSKSNNIKIADVNSAPVNANKSLDQSNFTEGNHSRHFDIHKSISNRNQTEDMKNDTLLNRNDNEQRLEVEVGLLNRTGDAKVKKGIVNTSKASLRQRDASGDIIPKSTGDKISAGTAFHSDGKKVLAHKSDSRERNYGGDEILKPKFPKKVELQDGNKQNYPFHFPLERDGYSEKVDETWPWEVIPLDNAYPELETNNTISVENPAFGLMEVPSNDINKQSNADLSSTRAGSKIGNIEGKGNAERNRNLLNQTLPDRTNSGREVSLNRHQLHNNLKAVLKSYYADTAKHKMSSSKKNYNDSNFDEEAKNRFLPTNNSTDPQHRSHDRSSKLPHFEKVNHIFVKNETKISNSSSPEKGNKNSPLDQIIDHVGQHNEEDKVDGENPYWILASADDLNTDHGIAESLGLFPKNEANIDLGNNDDINPFTPFVFNDQQKVKNISNKINSPKQMVGDKSGKGDNISGTIEYSGNTDDDSPSKKKPEDTKSLSNITDLAGKSDKTTVSTSDTLKAGIDSVNEKNIATKNFTLITNETLKSGGLNNMTGTSHLGSLSNVFENGSQIRDVGNASESVDSVSNDNYREAKNVIVSSNGNNTFENNPTNVSLHQTGVKIANTSSANIATKNVPSVNQASKLTYVDSGTSAGVLGDLDELLGNDENEGRQKNLTEGSRTDIEGWARDKKLGNTSSRSDHTKIHMMTLDGQKDKSIHSFKAHNNSSLNKVKPHRYDNINKSVVLDGLNNSIKQERPEKEKVKVASSKSKVSVDEGIAPEEHHKSEIKLKAEINKTKDQSTRLLETKLRNKSGNVAHSLIKNKSGDDTKVKNLHSVKISPDTGKSSLWGKNSKGDIISKHNLNKDIDNVSDIMELTQPNNYSAELNRSKGGIELAREEILDNDHLITADGNDTNRNIGKVRKLSQNRGEHKANIRGHKFSNTSIESTTDEMLQGEQSEYSKLGQILFNDAIDTNKASRLLNRTPGIQGDNGRNESTNYTSVANISSETRNSYNIRPSALDDKKNQRKDISSTEEIQVSGKGNKSRLWDQNKHGDEIPRPDTDIVKTKSIRKEDKQKYRVMKNESEVKDTGRQNGESKIVELRKGNKFGNTHVDESHENLNRGENANLWERNGEGDVIPEPNHDWLSEDEMEETGSKPDHQYSENELNENDGNYGNGIELEEINDNDKHLPTARNSWLSSDDIDFNPNSDLHFGEEKNQNKNTDTDTRFQDVNNEFERNIIPLSKEDGREIAGKNENKQGENLVSIIMVRVWG